MGPYDYGVRRVADRHSGNARHRDRSALNSFVRDRVRDAHRREYPDSGYGCHSRVPQFLKRGVRDGGNTSPHPRSELNAKLVDPVRSLRARDTCGNTVSRCSCLSKNQFPPPAGHRRNARKICAAPFGLLLGHVLKASAISSLAFCWRPNTGEARHPGPYEFGGASSSAAQWVQTRHSPWEEIGASTLPVASLAAPPEEEPYDQPQDADNAGFSRNNADRSPHHESDGGTLHSQRWPTPVIARDTSLLAPICDAYAARRGH